MLLGLSGTNGTIEERSHAFLKVIFLVRFDNNSYMDYCEKFILFLLKFLQVTTKRMIDEGNGTQVFHVPYELFG